VQAVDVAVFKWINGELACPAMDTVMLVLTWFGVGSIQCGLGLFLVFFGLLKDRLNWLRAGYGALAAFAVSGIAVQVGKHVWARPRPALALFDVNLVDVPRFSNSFPSGHTMTAFAVAVACCVFIPRLRWVLIPLAVLTGISRIYLGLHYPLDVVYGAGVGTVLGLISARWFRSKPKSANSELVTSE